MRDVLLAAVAGFGTGLSLIVAIGAQNAFVLRQGIRRDAVPAVVAICAASDAVLIALGVGGVGALVLAFPTVLTVAGVAGGVFLLCYGFLAARRAFRPSAMNISMGISTAPGTHRVVLTCLALTWLNPHVYLDTVLLLGTVAAHRGDLRWAFGAGAALASLCWFAALGFGARLLTGFFARPSSWRVLDALVAATMVTIGVTLVTGAG
ncbi:LysE/ArgO family amino acid transporter [Actinophytocola sp.]|uniref:LysE/ArgO family amino acid transporter n=1 Tax=Actinophytocola sp. TaxID=1872138 RepID=UPI003899FAE1